MEPHERRILLTTGFGHFMTHFNMLVFPSIVLPLSGRLQLGMAQVLGMSFWMSLLFGLTALPWGLAADRWGARPLMHLFFIGSGLCGLAATLFIDTVTGLTLALAGIGFFSGIYHPTGLGLISKGIKQISIGMGYNGMCGNLGLAAAPLLAGIVNWFWGLSAVFLTVCVLNFLGFAIMAFLPITKPTKKQDSGSEGETGRRSAFFILLIAMTLGGIVYRGSTLILPSYFELRNPGIFDFLSSLSELNLSTNLVATSVTSFIFIVGMLGQYIGGRLAEKFDLKVCYLIFHATTVPIAFLMAIAWDLPLVLLSLGYFFFLLGMQPIENTLVARYTPRRFQHSAYGLKFILTFGIGALAVKMVEAIENAYSIEAVFSTIGFISLALTGVILLLMANTKGSKKEFNPVTK